MDHLDVGLHITCVGETNSVGKKMSKSKNLKMELEILNFK